SRLYVKDLPKYVTEVRLRDVFSQKGEITDVQLKRSKDGKSRQFGYIGYRSEQEAQEALKYFNKSFIDTCRISIEIAYGVGDDNTPRPGKDNKNGAKPSCRILNNGYGKRDKRIKKELEVDEPALFQAFLDVTLRGKSKIWSNDMSIPPIAEVTSEEKVLAQLNNAKKRSSDTENSKKKKVVALSSDVSDVEYFKSKVKKNLSDSDSDSDDADVSGNEDGKMAQELKAIDTGRLIVLNLTYTTTEEEIMDRFSKFGEISEVHLVIDKETKRSKGFAFIHYLIPESASRAMKELDNKVFQGRLLSVLRADKQVAFPNKYDTCNLPKTFKKKREEQRKASEASGNSKAWNSLFIQPDTVLENMVRMYGVSKSELLDRESEDPAVRVALGEAKVIAETKEALAKAGVNVTSLEEFATGKCKKKIRSNHILLVKNLKFANTEKDLAQMFGKFGSLDKIILPPTKAMALVVFLESTEAKAAMKGLAYARNIDAPLYLEWAPEDILEPKTLSANDEKKSDVEENVVRRANLEQQFEIDLDITESNVLYIRNLSIKTSDESLKKHLTELMKKKQGKILSVKIIKHPKDGENRSNSYGFAEFDSVETATSVYRDLQRSVLDGHALILRFGENKRILRSCESKQSDTAGKGSDKDKPCTKLHVKNVAFEATKKELRQLFSPFGQVKGLRLPKRNISQFTGYAFVEFVTMQEATNAKKALSSTHFYGRRLVLEWANDDNSMKAIRARSGAKYMDQENNNLKKRKSPTVLDKSRFKVKRIAE
ncbi:hypothetical protein AALP_AA8G040800, partial [Arabis alpina]